MADEIKTFSQCAAMVEGCMKTDKSIGLLMDALKRYNCDMKDKQKIIGARCSIREDETEIPRGKIVVGSKFVQDKQARFCGSLRHQLLHVFDMCRYRFDYRVPNHKACTEIRAFNFFNCDKDEVDRFAPGPDFDKKASKKEQARARDPEQLHKNCVWQMAMQSMVGEIKGIKMEDKHKEEFKKTVTSEMEIAWNHCYSNLDPFGRRHIDPVDRG